MTDENQDGIPDELNKLAAVGRFLAANWLYVVVAVVVFGGGGTMLATWDDFKADLCAANVTIATDKVDRDWERKMFAYQLSHATETGKMLRDDCDRELELAGRGFSAAVSSVVDACDARLSNCEEKE